MTSWNERLQTLNRYYLIGMLLAVGGCGAVFITEGELLYSMMGFYALGLGLAWFTERDPFFRFLVILLPAVIFISIYTITRDDRVREPAIWLIPEQYTGPVYVFLNEKCGDPEKWEDEYRIYSIPVNGLALSQCTKNFGKELQLSRFFKVREDGTRYALKDIQNPQDTTYGAAMWRDSTGQPYFAFHGVPIKGESEAGRYYLEYAFIGTYRDYVAFTRNSPLPDFASDELLLRWQKARKECQ